MANHRKGTLMQSKNIASRIGRWSAAHRKTAILGWLVFVVALVGLMGNGCRRTRPLSPVDQIAGKAGEAERILDDAGLRRPRRSS